MRGRNREWSEETGCGGRMRGKRTGREERRPQSGPQKGWWPFRGGIKHRGSGRVCKDRDGGSRLNYAPIKLPTPKIAVPQPRPPTSVAKKPLGRCFPRDARPPGPGLSLALMVC